MSLYCAVSLQAVDVVGQAGKPNTITGFQTHATPVLLAYGERAELATKKCILYSTKRKTKEFQFEPLSHVYSNDKKHPIVKDSFC